MCFPDDLDAPTKSAIESQFDEFIDKTLGPAGLYKSCEASWSVETNVAVPGEDGKTGSQYVALITWRTVEDHLKNRELPEFKEWIHLLRTLPRLVKLNAVHVVSAKTRLAEDVR